MNSSRRTQKLIVRYAKAYYQVHKDRITLQTRNAIIHVSELLEKKRFFLILINNTLKDCTDLKVSIMSDFFTIHQLGLPFEKLIRLLLLHNRLTLIPQILKHIRTLYDLEANITLFQVTTATPISSDLQLMISTFLSSATKKTVFCDYSIDPSLIAGLKAQSNEFLYENSVRKKLHMLTHLID